MHAAARLAVGMARFAVFSLLVLLLCIVSTKATDDFADYYSESELSKSGSSIYNGSDYDEDYESGSGSGDDYDDNEDGDEEDSDPTVDPTIIQWTEDTDFYEDGLCKGQFPTSEYETHDNPISSTNPKISELVVTHIEVYKSIYACMHAQPKVYRSFCITVCYM